MFWNNFFTSIRTKWRPAKSNILGIDIGTTKIAAVVAKVDSEYTKILGVASVPFNGVVWTDHNKADITAEAIKLAVRIASKEAGCSTQSAVIGISDIATGKNSIGKIHINRRVSSHDLQRAVNAATDFIIPADMVILDQVVNSFTLDGQEGIKDPLDIITHSTLEAVTHTIICRRAVLNVVTAACKQAGLKVIKLTGSELAAASTLLSLEDKKQGVCLLDIGGEYTSMVVYLSGELCYTASIPWAGNHLTSCIGFMLGLDKIAAEKVKIAISENEAMSCINEQNTVLRSLINEKLRELCTLLNYELVKKELKGGLGAGIVITGGTSKLPGIAEIVARGFELPVRLAVFQSANWLKDVPLEYASAAGLVLHKS